MSENRENLLKIKEKYEILHSELNLLEHSVNELLFKQKNIHDELNSTRESERLLINKIEKEIGRKLDSSDILKIINENGF